MSPWPSAKQGWPEPSTSAPSAEDEGKMAEDADDLGAIDDCKWYVEGMPKPFSRARLVWGRWQGSSKYTQTVAEAVYLGYRRGMLVGSMGIYVICVPLDLMASLIGVLESLPAAKRGYYPTVEWKSTFGRGLSLLFGEVAGFAGVLIGALVGSLYWCIRAFTRLILLRVRSKSPSVARLLSTRGDP
jgi:hypothetical protein